MIDVDELKVRIHKLIDEYASKGSMGEVYTLYQVLELMGECRINELGESNVCMRKV